MTLLYSHVHPVKREGWRDQADCFTPPSALSLWLVVPRGFATSRTQRLTSMGVRPTGMRDRVRGVRCDTRLEDLRDFAKPSPCDRSADRPFHSGGEKLATDFSLFCREKAWVWRANRKLGQHRVPSVFLFHRAPFIMLRQSVKFARVAPAVRRDEKGDT